MKKIFFGILAMAALAACSTEEAIVTPKGEAIAFGNAFVDNSVRAEKADDPSYGTDKLLKEIYVYGTVTATNTVSIFEYEKVWTTADDGDYTKAWQCDKTQYWIAGGNYKFAAIAGIAEADVTCTNGIPSSLNFTSDGITDLVYGYYAKDNAAKSGNGLVAFDMTHLLSKVKFTLQNTNVAAAEYKYTVTNVRISNASTKSTCALSTTKDGDKFKVSGAWTAATDDEKGQAFGNITTEDFTNGTDECEQEKLLIPMSNPTIQFTLALYYGNELISSSDETFNPTVTLEQGKAYNFNIAVSVGEQIQFTVTENPTWVTANDTTVTPAPLN